MTMTPLEAATEVAPALTGDADSLQALYDLDSAHDPNISPYTYSVVYDAVGNIAAATSVTIDQSSETTTTRHFDAAGTETSRRVHTPDWVENYTDNKLTDITVRDETLSITEWVDGAGKPTKSVLIDKARNEVQLTLHQNGSYGPFTSVTPYRGSEGWT